MASDLYRLNQYRAAGGASRLANHRRIATTVGVTVCLMVAVAAAAVVSGCAGREVTTGPNEDTLEARVEAALASAADVNGAGITVDASDGVVTLTGQVASGTQQQSVGAIVRAVPGVRDVRFLLRIEGPGDRP